MAQGYLRILSVVFSFVSTMVALAASIYAHLAQNSSSKWRYTDEDSSEQQFTIESWVCQMSTRMKYYTFWNQTCTAAVSLRHQLCKHGCREAD